MPFTTSKIAFPTFEHITDDAIRIEMTRVASRAIDALAAAMVEPSVSRHRCDITNALNYLETIERQHNSALAKGAR